MLIKQDPDRKGCYDIFYEPDWTQFVSGELPIPEGDDDPDAAMIYFYAFHIEPIDALKIMEAVRNFGLGALTLHLDQGDGYLPRHVMVDGFSVRECGDDPENPDGLALVCYIAVPREHLSTSTSPSDEEE